MAQSVETYIVAVALVAEITTPVNDKLVRYFTVLQEGGVQNFAQKDSTGAVKLLSDSTNAACKFL